MTAYTTQLADLVLHDKEFLATVYEKLTTKAVLRSSGVIAGNAELDARASGPGSITSIPFWAPLAQTESHVGSDDPSVKVQADKISQGEQIAVRHYRNMAWSSMDLSAQLIADDPMDAIANRVAEFWAVDEEKMGLAVINGILADDAADSSFNHIASTALGGTDTFDINLLIDGLGTVGDSYRMFDQGVILCHSKVYRDMQKQAATQFIPKNKTEIGFDTYAGYRIVVNDLMPVATGVYTSAILAPGFLQAGEGAAKKPLAVFRDEAAGNGSGQETLYHRRQQILHPAGMKWLGASVAGYSPTNAEIATAANWALAYDHKNLGVVYLKSN